MPTKKTTPKSTAKSTPKKTLKSGELTAYGARELVKELKALNADNAHKIALLQQELSNARKSVSLKQTRCDRTSEELDQTKAELDRTKKTLEELRKAAEAKRVDYVNLNIRYENVATELKQIKANREDYDRIQTRLIRSEEYAEQTHRKYAEMEARYDTAKDLIVALGKGLGK